MKLYVVLNAGETNYEVNTLYVGANDKDDVNEVLEKEGLNPDCCVITEFEFKRGVIMSQKILTEVR